jgi:hypothetical protein
MADSDPRLQSLLLGIWRKIALTSSESSSDLTHLRLLALTDFNWASAS